MALLERSAWIMVASLALLAILFWIIFGSDALKHLIT